MANSLPCPGFDADLEHPFQNQNQKHLIVYVFYYIRITAVPIEKMLLLAVQVSVTADISLQEC